MSCEPGQLITGRSLQRRVWPRAGADAGQVGLWGRRCPAQSPGLGQAGVCFAGSQGQRGTSPAFEVRAQRTGSPMQPWGQRSQERGGHVPTQPSHCPTPTLVPGFHRARRVARTEAGAAHGPVGGEGASVPHTPALRLPRTRPPDSGPSGPLPVRVALAEKPGRSLPYPAPATLLGSSEAAGPAAEPRLPQCVPWPAPSSTQWALLLGIRCGDLAAPGGVWARGLCPTPAGPHRHVTGKASGPGAGSASRGAVQAAGPFCSSWGRWVRPPASQAHPPHAGLPACCLSE